MSRLPLMLLSVACVFPAGFRVARAAEPVSFSRDIRPILSANCFACHGPDEAGREAELRLDRREDATAERAGTRAIVPGDPSASGLYLRISAADADERMPPADSGLHLSAEQVALLRRWIEQGADYSQHWAFVKPEPAFLPAVQQRAWPQNAIDYFILAKLEERGLDPAPEADRFTLARRLSLDLIGLPPTPEEVDRFVRDPAPDAYERLVDRLLASGRFGEHWAVLWLDLARYADTKGYEKDQPREIWRFRDWVIDALNSDMPYDRFTVEQLAGDLLPDPTPDQILATAFHRNTMTNDEGGTDNEEFRVAAVKDRVDTTMQVWMGLTMGCAKCHSHKYDPITMRDYYRFFAFFDQTEDADRPDDQPRVKTPTEWQSLQLRSLQRRKEELQAKQKSRAGETDGEVSERLKGVERQIAELQKGIPETPVMRELPADRRRTTHVHVRGNFLEHGEQVEPEVPESFPALPDGAPRNRVGVARWLTDPENPLTSRVAVNRVWSRLFGTGLVETEEDFGSQGSAPSHPELLDHLAVQFQGAHAWSLKQVCRMIVLSAAYRQASSVDREKEEADPRNRLLSRGARFRLPAETMRDQALAASGLLSTRMRGPSVMPPQPDGIWRTTYSTLRWQTSPAGDRYRRGLYTFLRRTSPYPSMLAFDAGSREVCLVRRVRTNTPLQALVTMNDPVYVEASLALARRVLAEAAPDPSSRAAHGFRLLLVRPPRNEETERLVEMYRTARDEFRDQPAAAGALIESTGAIPPDQQEDLGELAAWTVVGNVILNLDETMTRH